MFFSTTNYKPSMQRWYYWFSKTLHLTKKLPSWYSWYTSSWCPFHLRNWVQDIESRFLGFSASCPTGKFWENHPSLIDCALEETDKSASNILVLPLNFFLVYNMDSKVVLLHYWQEYLVARKVNTSIEGFWRLKEVNIAI